MLILSGAVGLIDVLGVLVDMIVVGVPALFDAVAAAGVARGGGGGGGFRRSVNALGVSFDEESRSCHTDGEAPLGLARVCAS